MFLDAINRAYQAMCRSHERAIREAEDRRAKALREVQAARERGDTRRLHEAEAQAKALTTEALRLEVTETATRRMGA